jgi:peroxiredoxin
MTIDTPRETQRAVPQRGEQIPSFSGRTPDGRTLGTRDFYMRRNLALVFTHGPECAACKTLLRELAAREEAVRAEAGETLAVVPGDLVPVSAMSEGLPFPVVVDGDLALHRRYSLVDAAGKPQAAIFAVDRYGTVFEPSVADADHAMMPADEVPGWLEFIACRCS